MGRERQLLPPRVIAPLAAIDVSSWFYDDWRLLVRVVLMGIIAYPAMILLLRVSGKRTLSKMNAFDMVITIAMGSVFASVLLSKTVSVAEGVLAFAVLVGLQWSAATLSVRSATFRHLIKATPTILYWGDAFLPEVCRRERVSESEIRCAVRTSGYGQMSDVQAVILETTGDLSVIPKSNVGDDLPATADEVGDDDDLTALLDPTNRAGDA